MAIQNKLYSRATSKIVRRWKKNFDKIIENTKQSKQGNSNFIHYIYNAVKNASIDQMNDLINFWKKEHKDWIFNCKIPFWWSICVKKAKKTNYYLKFSYVLFVN